MTFCNTSKNIKNPTSVLRTLEDSFPVLSGIKRKTLDYVEDTTSRTPRVPWILNVLQISMTFSSSFFSSNANFAVPRFLFFCLSFCLHVHFPWPQTCLKVWPCGRVLGLGGMARLHLSPGTFMSWWNIVYFQHWARERFHRTVKKTNKRGVGLPCSTFPSSLRFYYELWIS